MKIKQQLNNNDCAISVINYFYNYFYNKKVKYENIKSKAFLDEKGINMESFALLCNKFNLEVNFFEASFDEFIDLKLNEPIATLIKNDKDFHYIIVTKIKKNKIYVKDPFLGNLIYLDKEFKDLFLNIIVSVEKATNIKKLEIKKRQIFLFKLFNFKIQIISCIISSISLCASFILSFYLSILFDKIFPNNLRQDLIILSVGFIILSILNLLISQIKAFIFNKLEIKISIYYLEEFLLKIEKTNYEFLNQKTESEYFENISFIGQIISYQCNYLNMLIANIISLIFSTSILLYINYEIFILSCLSTLFLVLFAFLVNKKNKDNNKTLINKGIILNNVLLNIIKNKDIFKSDCFSIIPKYEFNKIKNNLVKIQNKNNLFNTLFISLVNGLIKLIIPFLIVLISSSKIFLNQIECGKIILFFSIFNYFSSPIEQISLTIFNYPILKYQCHKVNEFFMLEEDDEEKNKDCFNEQINKIVFKNVNFGYNYLEIFLNIDNLSFSGKIKLEGKNGSGKSTIFRLIYGLIKPKKGDIYFNNKNISSFQTSSFRNKIFYLNNNGFITKCKLIDFITNNILELKEIFLTKDNKYKISQNILKHLNLNYDFQIEPDGKNLSAGQKQTILILKTLVNINKKDVFLFDESLENIDQKTFNLLIPILKEELSKKIVIEISHSKKYIFENEGFTYELN